MKNKQDIISRILDEKERFRKPVTMEEGDEVDWKRILRKINLYLRNQFISGDLDSEGFKKRFISIIQRVVKTIRKSIDVDTKDVRVIAEKGKSYYPSLLFGMELRQFMKDEGFGELFNDIGDSVSKYGWVIVKDVKGSPQIVDLKNVVFDVGVDGDIADSPYIHEYHYYSLDEFESQAADNGWGNVDAVIKAYSDAEKTQVKIVERYGYVRRFELEGEEGDELVRSRFIVAGIDLHEESKKGDKPVVNPITVHQVLWGDKWPYRDFKLEKISGRMPGLGPIENLFNQQEYANEVMHNERKSLHWSSKKLWQTKDEAVNRNLFTQHKNGDVLPVGVNNEITPIPMEDRNLPQYNSILERLANNVDQNEFTYEINTGEQLQSGTPFRLGALLSNAVNSHFEYQRERVSLFYKGLIWDFVVPRFKRRAKKPHTVVIGSDSKDIELFEEIMIDLWLEEQISKHKRRTGSSPTTEEALRERERIQAKIKKRDSLFMNLPAGFYDNLSTRIEIVITGESVNIGSDIETLSTILTTAAQQPAILENETLRGVFDQAINLAGVNPRTINTGTSGVDQQPQQVQSQPLGQLGQQPITQPV